MILDKCLFVRQAEQNTPGRLSLLCSITELLFLQFYIDERLENVVYRDGKSREDKLEIDFLYPFFFQ